MGLCVHFAAVYVLLCALQVPGLSPPPDAFEKQTAEHIETSSTLQWAMEGMVEVGPVKMGIPGILSLFMFGNPLFEVVPKLWRDRSVNRLPLLPYSAMFMAGLIWSFYGVLVGNLNVLIANGVSVILSIIYIHSFMRFCPPDADWLPLSRQAHIVAMVVTSLYCCCSVWLLPQARAIMLLGITGCVLASIMFAGPLAAVRTVIEEKNTRSLPFIFTLGVTLNGAVWSFYAIYVRYDRMILFPNAMGFLCGLAQISLFAVYGVAKNEKLESMPLAGTKIP
jgi:solute carrier family 50 protein (sugar transporter)